VGLRLTGSFKPMAGMKVKSLPTKALVPPPIWSPTYFNKAVVYESISGWSIDPNGRTVSRTTTSSVTNIPLYFAVTGPLQYWEWEILDIDPTANTWLGIMWAAPNDNTWPSWNPVLTSRLSVAIKGTGTVTKGGADTAAKHPPLKAGDIVGFAVRTTTGSGTQVSIHVNGQWRSGTGAIAPVANIDAGSANTVTNYDIRHRPWIPTVGATGAAKLSVKINTGQESSVYRPSSYATLSTPASQVNLNAGPYGTKLTDQQISFGTLNNVMVARSSRPIPNLLPFYFEVTIANVKSSSCVGFKHYKATDNVGIGANTAGWGEDGFMIASGQSRTYNNLGTSNIGTTPVGSTITLGFARLGGRLWVRRPTGWIGDPVAQTGAIPLYSDFDHRTFFAVSDNSGAVTTYTFNPGSSPFVYGVPSGFEAWSSISY
jgi:hypothetical protein